MPKSLKFSLKKNQAQHLKIDRFTCPSVCQLFNKRIDLSKGIFFFNLGINNVWAAQNVSTMQCRLQKNTLSIFSLDSFKQVPVSCICAKFYRLLIEMHHDVEMPFTFSTMPGH